MKKVLITILVAIVVIVGVYESTRNLKIEQMTDEQKAKLSSEYSGYTFVEYEGIYHGDYVYRSINDEQHEVESHVSIKGMAKEVRKGYNKQFNDFVLDIFKV